MRFGFEMGRIRSPTGVRRWGSPFFTSFRWALGLAVTGGCVSAPLRPPPARVATPPPMERVALRPVSDRETEPVVNGTAPAVPAPETPGDEATASTPIPPAVPADAPAETDNGQRRRHELQPGDVIRIDVFREAELSGQFRLTPDGDIQHPLLGVVSLRGKTVGDAEALIRRMLSEKYLVNPRVFLRLESTTASQVVLIGEVKSPGILTVPFGEPITLLQAIAKAGGFTAKASPNRITVVRIVEGKQVTLRVRVADVLSGRGGHRDVPLEPNDVIRVPEVWF